MRTAVNAWALGKPEDALGWADGMHGGVTPDRESASHATADVSAA